MDHDVLTVKLARSARSISRLTTATKIICGVMLAIALIMLLYAFSRLDRHTDDFVGFGLMAVGIAAFATLFWSTAAFHAAFGESLGVLSSVQESLEILVARNKVPLPVDVRPAPVSAPAPAPVSAPTPISAPAPAIAAPPSPAILDVPEGLAETRVAVVTVDESGVARATPANGVSPLGSAAQKSRPAMRGCPHCGGEIRADASRCRYCFEHV